MDVFSKDFDAAAALKGDGAENLPSTSVVRHDSIDDFEEHLVETNIRLCEQLLAVELSKTQQKVKLPTGKKREKNLEALCEQRAGRAGLSDTTHEVVGGAPDVKKDGFDEASSSTAVRSVVDIYTKKPDTKDVLNRMKKMEGPLGKLRVWVEDRRRVRIVLRGRGAPNAVVTAVIVAFDKHWNIIFRDGDEVFLPPAKISREISKEELDKLDVGYRRVERTRGEENFGNIGESRKLFARHLPCSMVRGENVVLIQKA